MATPRRSNRGGYSKGKRNDEEDDGGQTRCVCKEQHHEGVMIQCETCKVWQHCRCVGLGEGEVTPDKYYCDSCQPENHPYKVVGGQLISNSKPSSTLKTTKKRSTMNSKEASIPMDLMLAQQKWNEEHQDELEDDFAPRTSSKRRKKTESNSTEFDDDTQPQDPSKESGASSPSAATSTVAAAAAASTSLSEKKREKKRSSPSVAVATTTNDQGGAATVTTATTTGAGATTSPSASSSSSSPKTSSPGGGRMGSSKKYSSKSAAKARSRSLSPPVNGGVESRPYEQDNTSTVPNTNTSTSSSHHEPESSTTNAAKSKASLKNGWTATNEEECKRTAAVDEVGLSTKRRKTSSREMASQSESASLEDAEDAASKAELNLEHADMPKSRKAGGSSRMSIKRNSNALTSKDDNDVSREDSAAPNSSSHQQVPSVSSPAASTKKSFPRRNGDRGASMRTGSRHSTPTPANEGTPQPMAPAAPATVRYPSSKMTIHEMTKRAKQLLDYISRVQIDMADRKNKSGSQSPSEKTPAQTSTSHRPHYHEDVEMRTVRDAKDEPSLFLLPGPASMTAASMHGDSQLCPDLSRSSMDSNTSSLDGNHEPSSPTDTKVPTKEATGGREMTIKVIPMTAHDTLPLLSTPPLSVHDHHHSHHHHHHRLGSGTPESETTHEPLTPPHHPSEGDGHQDDKDLLPSSIGGKEVETKTEVEAITSLELMDKLTGDLIRFQEKFGAHA